MTSEAAAEYWKILPDCAIREREARERVEAERVEMERRESERQEKEDAKSQSNCGIAEKSDDGVWIPVMQESANCTEDFDEVFAASINL